MGNQQQTSETIIGIQRDAEAIFGSAEKAQVWLTTHNAALKATPISILGTPSGAAEVKKALNAIKYGGVV